MYSIKRFVTNRPERGDTLVEVMIAIAIISLILGGAYVTTNRSLQATRAAQERAVALKLAESQIERLKGLIATNPSAVQTATNPFCVSYTTGLPVATTNAECALNTEALQTTSEPIFRISILRGGPTGNDFVLTEQWENVGGAVNKNNLQLRYRLYE